MFEIVKKSFKKYHSFTCPISNLHHKKHFLNNLN